MRPDRTVVVGQRVVSRLNGGHRSNSPPGEEVRAHEALRYSSSPLGRDDSCIEAMSGIRGAHTARVFLTIERQSIGAEIFAPELFFKLRAQGLCLHLKLAALFQIAQYAAQPGGRKLRGIDIPLNFAKGDGRGGNFSI